MVKLILLCKIVLIATVCIGVVWFVYWYEEHVVRN